MIPNCGESSDATPLVVVPDSAAPAGRLLRDLRATPEGLDSREAERRFVRYGPNELTRRSRPAWPREIADQFTHPLALLLLLAGALAFVAGTPVLGWTILAVVLLNAVFAFVQEQQAERAVEALRRYVPQHASALRDGHMSRIEAARVVPGDVLVLAEGDRVPADARLLTGEVQVENARAHVG
jgi:magnesium-transporting ATPase (P-type)